MVIQKKGVVIMLIKKYYDGATEVEWHNDYIPKTKYENDIRIKNLTTTLERLYQELLLQKNEEKNK